MVQVAAFALGLLVFSWSWQHAGCKFHPANEKSLREDQPSATNRASVVNGTDCNVTLQVTDPDGRVFEGDYLPFGMKVKLKIEADSRNKTFTAIPILCHLVAVTSKRKYVILQNGCGDDLIISKTNGFTIHDGIGFSSIFRVFDFSNDDHIKFSCNVLLRKHHNLSNSCDISSTIFKASGEPFQDVDAKILNQMKGGNSSITRYVESRVIGLTLPQQCGSKQKRGESRLTNNETLTNNGTLSSRNVKYIDDPLHVRRLIFILGFFGLYLFILSVCISIQIDRNKIEVMRRPIA